MSKHEKLINGRYRVLERDGVEEHGVDMGGNPVLVRPPAASYSGVAFIEQEEAERTARIAASVESPWLLPVFCSSPRVVYSVPPSAARPGKLAPADAVECVLQLCDVLARLHAAGWLLGLLTDARNLRVSLENDGWRLTVVIPHLPVQTARPYTLPWSSQSPVRGDLRAVASFFRDLLIAQVPTATRPIRGQPVKPEAPFPEIGDVSVEAMIRRLLEDPGSDHAPADVASLALRLLPLAADRKAWADRIASLPRVSVVAWRPDFDRMIELGDAERAKSTHPVNPQLSVALAAARHQRACAAYASGNLKSALRDLNKAVELDPWTRYLVTRGVVRDALGDRPGARADYDRAVAQEPPPDPSLFESDPMWRIWGDRERSAFERARALYSRSVARLRVREVEDARKDLEEALAITLALRAREEGPGASAARWKQELSALERRERRALQAALNGKVVEEKRGSEDEGTGTEWLVSPRPGGD